MDWPLVLGLGVVLAAGAFVQSSIGFGMAVVAAPFIVLLEPALMPGALLVTTFSLPVVQLAHGATDIAWRPLGWALTGRLLLTPVGVAVVAFFSARAIAATVGVLILATVAVSVRSLRVDPTPRASFLAGAIGGISGTAASIGGPFMALVLQGQRPERVRSTLAAFFLVGAAMAVVGLAIGGQFTREQLLVGLVWIPFLAVGYAAAAPMRRRLDRERLRTAVLWFCVVASVTVIVRAAVA
jgi:uncharacterized membrane protein YfcA